MKRIFTLFMFLLLLQGLQPVQAQTDTEFWFAVPKLSQSHDWGRRKFFIRVATLNLPATITISLPADPTFQPMVFDVPANTALTVPLLSDQAYNYNDDLADILADGVEEYIFRLWNELPDVVYDRGIHIHATNLITAYFEIGTINNPDIFSLKGRNALGKDFFVPFQNIHYNQPINPTRPYSGIYIVATEDNTKITITPTRPVFPGRPAGVPFDIILQRGQSIGISPEDYNNTGQLAANHLGGTRVESDKPIAITTSDDSVRGLPGGCYDVIGDQIIPTSIIGTEYIAMKGRLTIPEYFYVVATKPNTQVYLDNDPVPAVVLDNAGQMYRVEMTNQSYHIRTSKPSYVYHVAGFGCEMGGAVLPPINVCTGSTEVAFTRSKGESFFLNILVRAEAQDGFILRAGAGAPQGPNTVIHATHFEEVPGTNDWLVAVFESGEDGFPNIPVGEASLVRNTKDVFHLAIINGGATSGTMYGYFSDFNELNVRAHISGTDVITKSCFGDPVQLIAQGGINYSWYPPEFLDNPTIATPVSLPDRNIKYTVTVSGACNMTDSTSVDIVLADPVKALFTVENSVGCSPFEVNIVDESIGVSNYLWTMGDGTQISTTANNQPDEFVHTYINQSDTVQVWDLMLVARNSYACTDTMFTKITVYPEVESKLTADVVSGCAPLVVDFGNESSSSAQSFRWDFGDGASSLDTIVSHTFNNYTHKDTTYQVILKATTVFGCVDYDTILIHVDPYIETSFDFDAPVHCNPYPIEITNTSYGVLNNTWSFDGGVTQHEDNNTVFTRLLENTTDASMVFDIWLYGENAYGCKDSILRPVTVYPPVISDFTPDIVQGCNPLVVDFTNNSIGANNYLWDFDLGEGTSSAQNPLVVFDNQSTVDTAVFHVQLLATSEYFCQDSSSIEITVYPRISANFTFDYTSYCTPQEITFQNHSQGGLNHYWNFGDGHFEVNNQDEIAYMYENTTANDVEYIVSLVMENASGCTDTLDRSVVIYPEVKADFDMEMSGCHPLEVAFENHSIGANQYYWDFGDGGSSQSPTPNRTFFNEDHYSNVSYQVELVALSQFGCLDTLRKDVVVYPKPFADFETSTKTGCSPLEIDFLESSLGAGLVFEWDFDDGGDNLINPGNTSYIYNNTHDSVRTFTSRLITTNMQGCKDTVYRKVSVYPEVNAMVNLSVMRGCHPLEVQITNASQGATASTPYLWDYGDGQQSTSQEPVQNYIFNNFGHTQNLEYEIQLNAESMYGCKDSITQRITVNPRPAAGFQPHVLEGCSPLLVDFMDSSIGGNKYEWQFGDGNESLQTGNTTHIFHQPYDTDPGEFSIHLKVENSYGCWDTTRHQVLVYPDVTADFSATLQGCHPLEIDFENLSLGVFEHNWSFGDGNSTNAVHPNHIFYNESHTQTKTYDLTLHTQSGFGCEAVKSEQVVVHPKPKSDFRINLHDGCSPLEVDIENLSVGASNFNWNLGGTTLYNDSPTFEHIFRNLDEVPVTKQLHLVSSNEYGCFRESNQEVLVYPEVIADFSSNNLLYAGCNPLELNFENNSQRGHEILWSFGDGTYSTSHEPTNVFFTHSNDESNYHVELLVNSVYGCMDSKDQKVKVYPVPVADIFVTPHQQTFPETSVTADNLSAEGSWSYSWDMGDGTRINTPGNESITHEYQWADNNYSSREYTIGLHVSNLFCHDTISQTIRINAPYPIVGFRPDSQGCPPLEVQFVNESSYGTDFLWEFRDGSLSYEEHPRHIFTEPGEYHVKLQVRGEGGIDSAFRKITVFEPPIANFRVFPSNIHIPYEAAQMVNLSSMGSQYEWHFGDGNMSYEFEPSYMYEEPGTFDITLKVATNTDPQCFDQMTKSGAVLAEQPCKLIFPNAFTPNSGGPSGGQYVYGDPSNHVFYPVHTGLQDYRLEIYNRWGEFIFRSTDVNIGWDGYYRGNLSPMDVYVWKVWATCYSGKEIKEVGDVTLYR